MVDKSEKFRWLVRLGYAARGLVYILLGYLALSTAGKAEEGQSAVFDLIQDVPLGTPLLFAVAVGLVAYASYKLIDAISDVENHGGGAEGVFKRIGSAASGVAHLALAWTAWRFATGDKHGSDGKSGGQEAASTLLSWDLGSLLIGLVGLGFVAAAAKQAKNAWDAHFMKHISSGAPGGIETLGRIGHAARAVVFLIISWSLLKSAWLVQSSQVKGLGEAIMALSDNGILYTLVAVGLILFGIFSLVVARYRIIPDVRKQSLKPTLH